MILSLLPLRGMGVRAILAALPSLLKREDERETFMVYISDCLQAITKNTSKYAGGSVVKKRFYDFVNPAKKVAKTGEQIAVEVIKNAGLKVVSAR